MKSNKRPFDAELLARAALHLAGRRWPPRELEHLTQEAGSGLVSSIEDLFDMLHSLCDQDLGNIPLPARGPTGD